MKKLSKKQRQQIKAGKGVTGALLTGIGNIFKGFGQGIGSIFNGMSNVYKSIFTGISTIGNTIGGWIVGSRELSRGHVKAQVKMADGKAEISYDDSQMIKTEGDVLSEKIKAEHGATNSTKHVVDISKNQEVVAHHTDDIAHIDVNDIHMMNDFMHF